MNLVPTITISSGASINLNNTAQNFSSPVTYTVTAEDGTTQNYIVTVTVAQNPNPNPGPECHSFHQSRVIPLMEPRAISQ